MPFLSALSSFVTWNLKILTHPLMKKENFPSLIELPCCGGHKCFPAFCPSCPSWRPSTQGVEEWWGVLSFWSHVAEGEPALGGWGQAGLANGSTWKSHFSLFFEIIIPFLSPKHNQRDCSVAKVASLLWNDAQIYKGSKYTGWCSHSLMLRCLLVSVMGQWGEDGEED